MPSKKGSHRVKSGRAQITERFSRVCINLGAVEVQTALVYNSVFPLTLVAALTPGFETLKFGSDRSFTRVDHLGATPLTSLANVKTLVLGPDIKFVEGDMETPRNIFSSLPRLLSLQMSDAFGSSVALFAIFLHPLVATLRHLTLDGCSKHEDHRDCLPQCVAVWSSILSSRVALEQVDFTLHPNETLGPILAAIPRTVTQIQLDVYPDDNSGYARGKDLSERTKLLDPLLRDFAATMVPDSSLRTVRLYGTAGAGWYSVKTEVEALNIRAVSRATLDAFAAQEVAVVFAGGARRFAYSTFRAPQSSHETFNILITYV